MAARDGVGVEESSPRSNDPTALRELDDAALMRLVCREHEAAFSVLVERHQACVLGHVQRMVGPHDAEDVAQIAFLRVWQHARRYDVRFSLRSWLLVIASRLALNQLRDRRPHRLPALDACGQLAAAQATPAERIAEADERSVMLGKLEAALDRLEPQVRMLYELRFRQQLEIAEIAAHFGSNPNAVKQRLHRLKQSLIAHLGGSDA